MLYLNQKLNSLKLTRKLILKVTDIHFLRVNKILRKEKIDQK